MRQALFAALLFFATAASAYEHPVITPNVVRLKPAETATLALSAYWSGLTPLPQHNVFGSDAPEVAEISGSLTYAGSFNTPPVFEPIRIKALSPGVAHVIDVDMKERHYATVIVECDPVGSAFAVPAQPLLAANVLSSVTLEVIASGFESPSYDWFWGSTGDKTVPIPGNGDRMPVVLYAPGVFHVWAEVTDRCNYATVEFTINVASSAAPRRRAARH